MFRLAFILIPLRTVNRIEKRGEGLAETAYYYTDVYLFGLRIARFHRNEFA